MSFVPFHVLSSSRCQGVSTTTAHGRFGVTLIVLYGDDVNHYITLSRRTRLPSTCMADGGALIYLPHRLSVSPFDVKCHIRTQTLAR